jgi:hypothetical protein
MYTKQQIDKIAMSSGTTPDKVIKVLVEKWETVFWVNDTAQAMMENSTEINNIRNNNPNDKPSWMSQVWWQLSELSWDIVSWAINTWKWIATWATSRISDLPRQGWEVILWIMKWFDKLTGQDKWKDYSFLEKTYSKEFQKELWQKDLWVMLWDLINVDKYSSATQIWQWVWAMAVDLVSANKFKPISWLYKKSSEIIDNIWEKILTYKPKLLEKILETSTWKIAGNIVSNTTKWAALWATDTIITEVVFHQELPTSWELMFGSVLWAWIHNIFKWASRVATGSEETLQKNNDDLVKQILYRPVLLFESKNLPIEEGIKNANSMMIKVWKKLAETDAPKTVWNIKRATEQIMVDLMEERKVISSSLWEKIWNVNIDKFNRADWVKKPVWEKIRVWDEKKWKMVENKNYFIKEKKPTNIILDWIEVINDIKVSEKNQMLPIYQSMQDVIKKVKLEQDLTLDELIDFRAWYNYITKEQRFNKDFVSKKGKTSNDLQVITDDIQSRIDNLMKETSENLWVSKTEFNRIKEINKEYFNTIEYSSWLEATANKIVKDTAKIIDSLQSGIDSRLKWVIWKGAWLLTATKSAATLRVASEIASYNGVLSKSKLDEHLPKIFDQYDDFIIKNQHLMDKIVDKYAYGKNIDMEEMRDIYIPSIWLIRWQLRDYEDFIRKNLIVWSYSNSMSSDDVYEDYYREWNTKVVPFKID